jgi:hypothetical protein
MPVHPVPRPLQDFREIVVCHLDSLAKMPDLGKARQITAFTDSCGEPKKDAPLPVYRGLMLGRELEPGRRQGAETTEGSGRLNKMTAANEFR